MNQTPAIETLSIETASVEASSAGSVEGSIESSGHQIVVNATKASAEDRWSHEIVVVNNKSKTVLLRSIEGDAQSTWPPSPPLQEINKHDLGHAEALLGVGMAGKSHWSASLSTESTTMVADLACLVKHDSDEMKLGSTYRVDENAKVTIVSPHELQISDANASHQLILQSRNIDGQNCEISFEDGLIRIKPVDSGSKKTGQKRWCFVMSLK